MIFFTSDTHFGHAGALWLYKRPFGSVAEMDAAMLARWNETVGPKDEVWHLGDFAIRQSAERVTELLGTLNGCKHLVAGNNDPTAVREHPGWASVRDYAEMVVDETRLVLCHYAFRTWNGMGKGAIDLHGHSHGRLKGQQRQLDVGVDAWEFRPIPLEVIRFAVQRRRTGPNPKPAPA